MTVRAEEGSRRLRPRRAIVLGPLAVLVALLCAVIAVPLANPLFPERAVESCTMTDQLRARRDIVPRIASDCGSFTSWRRDVVCTDDESLEVNLTRGYTFDLVVRGPRIPFVSSPVLVSAGVSAEQKRRIAASSRTEEPGSEGIEADGFETAALRAYDYEQPPFDPKCEVGRSLMTAQGIQYVLPERADELLTPPAGVVPANPKLPCEGFHCDHRVHRRG